MKIAPILRSLDPVPELDNVLLHSGQHYDTNMSGAFFDELGIRPPDVALGVGSGTHGIQTAEVIRGVEQVLLSGDWAWVVVVGDVNSTLAAALAAAKLGIRVAHVEAGLRSGDRSMPEELNRLVTDQLSDLCLTPSRDANRNLQREGIGEDRIVFVGNVMIDTLRHALAHSEMPRILEGMAGPFALVTLHRPSNVDERDRLEGIVTALRTLSERMTVLFPVHPRTAERLGQFDIELGGVRAIAPLGYREMLGLQSRARLVLTDSGGLQEETSVLGIPCLTLRDSTERPITLTEGTNTLVPDRSSAAIQSAVDEALRRTHTPCTIEGWDGRAAERIRDTILARL